MLLCDDAATHQRLLELQLEYEKESGRKTMLMEGTSPGAAELGVAVI
ncbi:MAG: hypothetical protein HC898_01530 [Phycisphaerales bacterium]|nr:hypothetical protein [Phycisphaerales bacterium]